MIQSFLCYVEPPSTTNDSSAHFKVTRKSKLWTDDESKTLLEEYANLSPLVGPMKNGYRTKNDMWKAIAAIISKKHGNQEKTVQQLISRLVKTETLYEQ